MNRYSKFDLIFVGFAIGYLLFLMFSATTIVPYVDSYYYWLWSNQIQLSYYDGPPLIAYVIKISTLLFGNSVFATNLVGVVITVLSSVIVFYIAKNLTQNGKLSLKVAVLFLFGYTVVAHRIITFVTYDGLENLFELMMILFTLRYLATSKIKYIYLIGICAGFGLLSKYSAIVPIMIILGYFLFNKKLRLVFTQYHVYISMLACCAIFSPVIIWNFLHHWVSFTYQLSFHTHSNEFNFIIMIKSIGYYIGNAVIAPNIPLILLILVAVFIRYYKFKLNKCCPPESIIGQLTINTKSQINFLYTVLICTFIFWLCASIFADIPDRYLLYFHSILLILSGIILLKLGYNKIFALLLLYNVCFSIGDIVTHSLIIKNPVCYTQYILNHRLYFNSIFKAYIKSSPNSSNFCYLKIKEPISH